MKIMLILLAVFMSTVNAHAWSLWEINGAKMMIDGKDIRVASVKTEGDGHIFHSRDKELENGVYVIATLTESSSEVLPFSTALIRDYLRSRGLNVVEKAEGSALAIKFIVRDLSVDGNPANLSNEPNKQATSWSSQGAAIVTDVAAAKLAANLAGTATGALAHGMSGGFHYKGNELALNSVSIVDPTDEKLLMYISKYVRDKNGITARTAQNKSDPNTTVADLLTLMTKAWADKYFVKD